MEPNDLASRKQRLSPKLLAVDGVSGVGIGEGHVVVYLVDDSDSVREQARGIIDAQEPGTPVSFHITGAFRKT